MTGTDGFNVFRRWARLSFYYPGLTLAEIVDLPRVVQEVFLEEHESLVAESHMALADVIALPHMERKDQRAVLEGLKRTIRRNARKAGYVTEPDPIEDPEAFRKVAAGVGIGVRQEGDR